VTSGYKFSFSVHVDGEETHSGQITIRQLRAKHWQLSGWCPPKGQIPKDEDLISVRELTASSIEDAKDKTRTWLRSFMSFAIEEGKLANLSGTWTDIA